MKSLLPLVAATATILTARIAAAQVSVAFNDPAGGWTYALLGDNREPGAGGDFDGLDGTWSHNNGSDAYDGSDLGGDFDPANGPGGVAARTSNGVTFLRIQDTGNPNDAGLGLADPSNRKIYFGHDISTDAGVADPTLIGEAVTLSFRARLSTAATGALDPLHPAATGEQSTMPIGTAWPTAGTGTLIHDGGKGHFGIRQSDTESPGAGVISFALANAADWFSDGSEFGQTGLIMNNLNGSVPSGTVDAYQQEGTLNILPIADLTVFHEFWITIEDDQSGGGTHKVNVYLDGSTTPTTFHVTGGSGNDYTGLSYLGMGVGATPQISAVDVDFFAYKVGVVAPTGGGLPGDFNASGRVDGNDFVHWQQNNVTAAKLQEWRDNFGTGVQAAAARAVPEPGLLPLLGWLAFAWRPRRGACAWLPIRRIA
jgi:hypothetical protein